MQINPKKYQSNLGGAAATAAMLLAAHTVCAQVFTVDATTGTGPGTLDFAIIEANAYGNGATIDFQNNLGAINAGVLPAINVGMTLNGGVGNTVSGQNAHRIFFVNAPGQSVVIQSLTLTAGLAQGGMGGTGGGGGGGGAGMGGALFVNSGAVSLQSVSFTSNAAVGGAGGPSSYAGGGGGGGLDYSGGSGSTGVTFNSGYYLEGSGGGGGAHTSAGSNGNGFGAGNGGGINGAGPNFSAVGPDGAGGGGTLDTSGANLSGYQAPSGGNGGDFGGGGGGAGTIANSAGNGGNGGFGAGGGGGADAPTGYAGNGGNGGFGGGGGGGAGTSNEIYYGPSSGGTSAFNGGDGGYGNEGGGGGGAALGGAIFVRSTNGASVSFTDTSTDTGTVTGGAAGGSGLGHNGSSGAASGSALFLMGGNTVFTVDAGKTETVAGTIDQSQASGITLNGGGILVLSANNGGAPGYTGGTTINGGELSVSADNNLGNAAGGLTINGGFLQVTGTSYQSTSRAITLGGNGGGFDIANPSNVFTLSQSIGGNGGLTKIGPGTLALNGANTYIGITNVSNGSLELGFPYNGTAATLGAANVIDVASGGTLTLGSATGQTNVLGSGANAPNVSIPTINLAGGVLNNYQATTHNVGQVYLAGGTINGSSTTFSIFYDYTFNSAITVNASTSNAYISAAGGVGLRNLIPFNVSSGTGSLIVTAALHDEPNQTGGVTKNSAGQMLLEGTNTYSAGTIVNAGTLVFGGAGALPLSSALTINGGTASFMNVNTGTKFLSQLNSLSIAGNTNAWAGRLDLTNNDMLIHNGSLAVLTNQAREGYSNGTWDGTAGIISSSAANNTSHLTAIGIIQNNQSGAALFTNSHQFDGATPAAGDLLLKYTYYGDANLDGKVDGSDYALMDNGYLRKLTGWYNGDFNYDGVVDGSDYTLIDNAFNMQGAQITSVLATDQIAVSSTVPESSPMCCIAICAVASLCRRRRKMLGSETRCT